MVRELREFVAKVWIAAADLVMSRFCSPAFGVHFDPVNLICSPQICFHNDRMIRDFIARLGPQIRSCHAKDILLRDNFTVHLDEVRPGKGTLDYRVLLKELAKLDANMPLMLEHLSSADEYTAAAEYVRQMTPMRH
jgi:sugar phosphate isomerase/epimerase